MAKILLAGEPMMLFIAKTEGALEEVRDFTRSISGAEVNVAVGLRRLGHEAVYFTRVGEDPFGAGILRFLEKEKIDTSLIGRDKTRRTGLQFKAKNLKGDPEICYYRGGSAASAVTAAQLGAVGLKGFDHLHLTGIFPALSDTTREAAFALLARAKAAGLTATFDPNLRPMLWGSEAEMVRTLNDLACRADVVLPGAGEGKILTGFSDEREIAGFYLDRGVKAVVVKLGKKGAYYRSAQGEGYAPAFQEDRRVDTVGAGDGFAAGVVSALLEGLPLPAAVERGNAVGTMQIMSPYDNEDLPDRGTLETFMQTHRP